ncbi:ATP-binding protein [Paracoccus sediminilitoris]|uniref:ATP-binding protein n=1 Tax=Paracoccus sediminilitoris TaxID=2202419 RepID=UPI00272A84D2|nr:ATP-binding protein [Paracoccus sediminilitoris]
MLDSLFRQNIAVLAAAIPGALLVSLVLIAGLVLRPQIDRSAADTAQMIRSLDLSLRQMDPSQQIDFAEALRATELPDVLVAETAPEDANLQRSWHSTRFLRVLSDRHGISASDVLIDAKGRVWVRIHTSDRPYWLSLRTLPATDPIAGLAVASGIALPAALAGGIALQRRIARPLKRLEDAVGRMSRPSDAYDSDIEGPREIAAVSRALTEMSERLQAAEADRALMLAGVSHDLRTPLTKLRLTLAMLRDSDAELVAGAERNMLRIEGMLRQFLDFARGFEAEDTRAVPLRSLLQQAIESCTEPAAVMLDAPADVVIEVKAAALLRALDNLLSNALRHGKPPVALRARTRDRALTIDVRDAGSGLLPEEARELIRPFARGNAARAGEGTGLGLAIVDQVAKAHRGEVDFEQDAQTFTAHLSLPQAVVA